MAQPSQSIARLWTYGCAVVLVVVSAVTLLQGSPEVWAPWPTYMLIALLVSGPLAFIGPSVLFLLWSKQLLRGESRLPYRSLMLLFLVGSLSLLYFYANWPEGIMRYGNGYVATVATVNTVFFVVLGALSLWAFSRPSFGVALLFHFMLFLWLGWFAFPYFGEGL
jgi:hypothetical protein